MKTRKKSKLPHHEKINQKAMEIERKKNKTETPSSKRLVIYQRLRHDEGVFFISSYK